MHHPHFELNNAINWVNYDKLLGFITAYLMENSPVATQKSSSPFRGSSGSSELLSSPSKWAEKRVKCMLNAMENSPVATQQSSSPFRGSSGSSEWLSSPSKCVGDIKTQDKRVRHVKTHEKRVERVKHSDNESGSENGSNRVVLSQKRKRFEGYKPQHKRTTRPAIGTATLSLI